MHRLLQGANAFAAIAVPWCCCAWLPVNAHSLQCGSMSPLVTVCLYVAMRLAGRNVHVILKLHITTAAAAPLRY